MLPSHVDGRIQPIISPLDSTLVWKSDTWFLWRSLNLGFFILVWKVRVWLIGSCPCSVANLILLQYMRFWCRVTHLLMYLQHSVFNTSATTIGKISPYLLALGSSRCISHLIPSLYIGTGWSTHLDNEHSFLLRNKKKTLFPVDSTYLVPLTT